MIILGIDPGTASTGYGIIKKKRLFECIDYGVISTTPNSELGERLRKINNELSRIIKKHKPEVLAIENLFFFKNLKTAIPVSRAIGAILLTTAKKKLPVKEFTPLQIKLAITGNGRAEKKEVQKSLKKLLRLKEIPRPSHAADALAVAITYVLKEV